MHSTSLDPSIIRRLPLVVSLLLAMVAPCGTRAQSLTGAPTVGCNTLVQTEAGKTVGSFYDLVKLVGEEQRPHNDLVTVTAHRGGWEYCPENSEEGFFQAMDDGLEIIEMDVRTTSAADTTSAYPISSSGPYGSSTVAVGETVLIHDFDLRGEAIVPNTSGIRSDNLVYDQSSAQMATRYMVDRTGHLFYNANGQAEHRPTLEQLLNDYVSRELSMKGVLPSDAYSALKPVYCKTGTQPLPAEYVRYGAQVVIDIKGDPPGNPSIPNRLPPHFTTQVQTLLRAIAEVHHVECNLGINLAYAVVYKLSANVMESESQLMTDLSSLIYASNVTSEQYGGSYSPYLILITYPGDFAPTLASVTVNGTSFDKYYNPNTIDILQSFEGYSPLTPSTPGPQYPGWLFADWQNQWNGTALTSSLSAVRSLGLGAGQNDDVSYDPESNVPQVEGATTPYYGAASYWGTNSFPEGFRNSNGTCISKGGDPAYVFPCESQPQLKIASSTPDFINPPGSLGSSPNAVTTDWYQNAIYYLNAINGRCIQHILPSSTGNSLSSNPMCTDLRHDSYPTGSPLGTSN